MTLWLRSQPSIERAGLPYLFVVLGGMSCLLTFSLLHIGIPTVNVCLARSLLMPVATVSVFGVLGLRNSQLYRLSGNLYAPPKSLPASTITRYILPLALLLAFLWTVLAIQSPLVPTDIRLASWRYVGCSNADPELHNHVRSISLGIIVSVYLLAALISHKARNVGTGFSESRAIGISLANAFLITCAVMPVIDLDVTDQPTQFALRSTAIILSTSLFLVADIFPRLLRAYREMKAGNVPKDVHIGFSSPALKSFFASLPGLQSFVAGHASQHSSTSSRQQHAAGVKVIPVVKFTGAAAGSDNQLQKPSPSNASRSQQSRPMFKRAVDVDDSNPGLAVDIGFAREAVVSVRSSTRAWLLKAPHGPWHGYT
ncbi:hypothetical protein BCR44DRAFT_1067331 [Catenaria anguillulae PL171]|uniref:G-protein coupled receptors family 3 profile domain-containing protein n=1 Tax=Catenaria anguillulae PL171 TaxID=765915 RepID=A0A1Y2HPK1_9FUNG|nr:hypothetical protein BCR44DRAFT_1067331 [Catenaria anguillulae PL171]